MNNKIKLYIFHPYSKIGGADLSISRLIDGLSSKYDIDFICLKKNNLKIEKKIKIIEINCTRTIYSVKHIRNYIKKDKKNNYKKYIFLSNQNFANILTFIILFNLNWVKKILIERNHISELNYNKNIKNLIIKFFMKFLYKRANMVIGISKKLSSDLSKYCNCKVKTIYNPAYDKKIYKLKNKINSFFRFKNKNILLNVARLEKQKDHITLLKAIKIVLKKIDVFLIIVGYGSEKKKITNFIKKNKLKKNIIIIENISTPYNYFLNADLFILTSLYEGFGNVIVEAAMFNIPVISTNCLSGPKEILLNGKGGYLVEIGDYKKLAEKIIFCLENKNTVIKKVKILKSSLYRFSIQNNIRQYEKIFNEI